MPVSRVIDRSFIRFDNLALSYLVPAAITKKLDISQLRINGSVRNVAVYSPNWEYGDPEPDPASPFVPRTFTLGVNVVF